MLNIKMMMKKGILVGICMMWNLFGMYGQEYGYLVRTEITGAYHANDGWIEVDDSNGGGGSVSYFATDATVGDVNFDFFSLDNGFADVTVTANAKAIALAQYPNCDYSESFTITVEDFNDTGVRYFSGCNFSFRVYPLHVDVPDAANSTICLGEEITLGHGYDWQYSYDGITWENFPAEYNTPEPTFVLSDLLGDTTEPSVKFRTGYKNPDTGAEYYTNIVTYTVINCSPDLQSFTPTDTSCSYSEDGGFTAVFDRDLNPGERLIMTLHEIDQFGNEVTLNQYSTTTLDAGNVYTWPDPLGSGTYYMEYQTDNNGTPSSLEDSDPFTINSPNPVSFSATKTNDVYCFGGSDGAIGLTANGGVGNYRFMVEKDGNPYQGWTAFSGANAHALSGLPAGSYTLYVQDANGCEEQLGDGTEKTITITIEEPTEAVDITLASLQDATANGFTNGEIAVDISGGTPFGDGSYTLEWTDGTGAVLTSVSNQATASGYRTTLNNIGAGDYTLTVTDANFNSATQSGGCTVAGIYTVEEPPALTLAVQETNSISCNSTNTFGDPSSDGELRAVASGGVPFDPPLPSGDLYRYTWKEKDASGNWQVMTGVTGPVATGLPAGDYAVNIEDANGIVIGTYQDNALVVATDVEHPLNEPPLLSVTLSKQDVFCPSGSDGAVTATITGGTGNYSIFWNTGETTTTINNLTAGTYTVQVTDEKGCRAEASVTVTEPQAPLQITYRAFQPTYAGATDGWVEATVSGGTPRNDGSYGYLWKDAAGNDLTGQVTAQTVTGGYQLTLSDVGAGNYYLTVEDKNYPLATDNTGCTVVESGYTLEDPEPLTLTVTEQNPVSCNGSNTYNDPVSDGVLEAVAGGGVILAPGDNNGLPYYYTW
ncbi:SprB repeat-containing protein, partial [Galbibacter sp. EGI 63066]|uniref:SprB repeat-containing protein n=1 Tax=Galbibacter sp. EGI 63066 TaxID=2993559 RepID=UPI002248DEDF